MRRIATVAAIALAMSIPVGVATVSLAGTAGASSSIQCTGLKGTITGNVTISKCTPSGGKGYKSATGVATDLASSGTLTWKSSKATTGIDDGSANTVTPNACGKKGTEYSFTATVSSASTTGTGIPAVGDAVSADACVSSKGAITLLKGTKMEL
jgi:hypothetical protein